MRKVIEQADKYKTVVSRYEAEIYIKGKTEILKQNILMRFAHHLFPVDRKNKDMIFEMVSHSKFNAPNNYLHSFEAINGNSIPNGAKQQEVLTFLNLNVYSPTIYNEGIIMPVAYFIPSVFISIYSPFALYGEPSFARPAHEGK